MMRPSFSKTAFQAVFLAAFFVAFSTAIFLFSACRNASKNASPASPSLAEFFKKDTSKLQTGEVEMVKITTPKGDFRVWTKRIGQNPTLKVLLLHGGPAVPHEYFECFENYLPAEGIELIYYDQLGAGNSDQPRDTSLWDLPRFVEEVEQVRVALGLGPENLVLLGHSWGGILAMQYALKYQQNLKALVISNMMSDCRAYDKYAEDVLSKQIDPAVLAEIMALEKAKKTETPRYWELLNPHFYEKHILRMPVADWPEPVNRAFSRTNREQYVIMQGPSEFGISGKLENWDVSKRLSEIKKPTLVIGATHDTMDPKHMEWMAGQLSKGQFLLCPNGGHMAMWDDQKMYFAGLLAFLNAQR